MCVVYDSRSTRNERLRAMSIDSAINRFCFTAMESDNWDRALRGDKPRENRLPTHVRHAPADISDNGLSIRTSLDRRRLEPKCTETQSMEKAGKRSCESSYASLTATKRKFSSPNQRFVGREGKGTETKFALVLVRHSAKLNHGTRQWQHEN